MVGMNTMVNENYGGGYYGGEGESSQYGQQQQQPQYMEGGPPMAPGIRPKVDPEALGEVDPTVYPEPKESTHKIRGKSDILDFLCSNVDQDLLMAKTFYFFFYSAFGSLFPLMAVYFKQMGMNPGQCGVLIGFRPFVEFLSAPFWGSLADRWQKGKMLLLASVTCWIIFTLPIGFVQPPVVSCIMHNRTAYYLGVPDREFDKDIQRFKRAVSWSEVTPRTLPIINSERDLVGPHNLPHAHQRTKRATQPELPPKLSDGKSPVNVRFVVNYNEVDNYNWVTPLFSNNVYRVPDIQKVFFLLILLVLIGEFFSAPAITLADSAVITYLGEEADRYGHQRMFGSLGWGLAMFFVGIALDHSTSFPDHPCYLHEGEKNYTICFATFSVLMGCALITATQINFHYELGDPTQVPMDVVQNGPVQPPPEPEKKPDQGLQFGPSLTVPSELPPEPKPPLIGKTKMFAQTTRRIPEWVTVLKQFANLKCGTFLFVAWFMGFGIGLIFTFLFWHLQGYHGSPTLFGVASVINHISEIFAYFFSFRLIKQIGHVKVLCLGLAGNVIRFLYISWLSNPWWVLPFEFIQGITHAAVWAACCSYIAHNTPQHLRGSAQGVLQGIHHGLGRGCGAVIGGIFVNYFGTAITFRGYGFTCLLVLAGFIFINFYKKDTGFVSELPPTEDPHQVAEETAHLAPHGVPSNPIPRALSSSKLHELGDQQQQQPGYGATYQTSGGNLDIPGGGGGGGTNPFRDETYNYTNYEGQHYTRKSSPVPTNDVDDELIRHKFKVYNEVLSQYSKEADIAKPGPPITRLHALQPGQYQGPDTYDW